MALDKKELAELNFSFTRLAAADKPVLIYGTGNGCEKLFFVFERFGIRPAGIFASDDFKRERSFHGFDVLSLSEAEERYGDFYAVLAFGTSLPDVMERIEGIAKRHTLIAPELSVADDSFFEKTVFLDDYKNVEKAYSLLCDDKSREVFEDLCRFKITGDISYLKKTFTAPSKSCTDIINPTADEIVCDLGAYTGDTVDELLSHTGGKYRHIYCFEPDMRNFRRLVRSHLTLDNTDFINAAAWDSDTQLFFSASSGRQSAVSDKGRIVSGRSLDSYLDGREVTYIKYDVEGADVPALLGSKKTIEKFSPKICTAAYHRPYDFYRLILLLDTLRPGSRIYLRQHPYYPSWETNVFAV